jgi:hypothetical protein
MINLSLKNEDRVINWTLSFIIRLLNTAMYLSF